MNHKELNVSQLLNKALETAKCMAYRLRRPGIRKGLALTLRPVVLTTLGRTGSTFSIALLGAHPEIVAYRPYEAEARYASYWFQIFLSLSDPRSWTYPNAAYDRSGPGWVLGDSMNRTFLGSLYPQMIDWFQGQYSPALFSFCMKSLTGHYQKVSDAMNKKNTQYFCEKFYPDSLTEQFLSMIPEAKEVFLVRDFRDMFCSIMAFDKKRGFYGFGRDEFSSVEEYLLDGGQANAEGLLNSWQRRKESSFLLRYEDLILNTKDTLKALFQYLGVDDSSSTVARVTKGALEKSPESQKMHQTGVSPERSIGRFRHELTPERLELCNRAFRKGLEGFGYDV